MPQVDVDGIALHVQDLGAGDPVVLVPGFGLDHRLWDRQVRVLTDAGYRVLAVDQRGHGCSDKPLDGYDIDTLSSDLAAVIEARDVAGAVVVGHSLGGQVAFRLAAERPDLVGRLVLVGSNGVRASRGDDFPFGRPPEAVLPALLEAERTDRYRSRVAGIAGPFREPPHAELLADLVSQSMLLPSWSAVALFGTLMETDLMADLPRIAQPVLQVMGESDPVHSAKAAPWIAERLADSRLVMVPDSGHYLMLEQPAALETALLEFLAAAV